MKKVLAGLTAAIMGLFSTGCKDKDSGSSTSSYDVTEKTSAVETIENTVQTETAAATTTITVSSTAVVEDKPTTTEVVSEGIDVTESLDLSGSSATTYSGDVKVIIDDDED